MRIKFSDVAVDSMQNALDQIQGYRINIRLIYEAATNKDQPELMKRVQNQDMLVGGRTFGDGGESARLFHPVYDNPAYDPLKTDQDTTPIPVAIYDIDTLVVY